MEDATHQDVDGEGHDESGDEQVGNGQTDDEVIGGRLQRSLFVDTEDHQNVAEDGEEREEDEDESPVVAFLQLETSAADGSVGGRVAQPRLVGARQGHVGGQCGVQSGVRRADTVLCLHAGPQIGHGIDHIIGQRLEAAGWRVGRR